MRIVMTGSSFFKVWMNQKEKNFNSIVCLVMEQMDLSVSITKKHAMNRAKKKHFLLTFSLMKTDIYLK
jgi:hypothetical protein